VSRVKGSLGYVEYAYAKRNNIPVMQLQNRDGKFMMPDDTTFAAAAAGANWSSVPGMGISLVNQPGANAYPVVTASFILMYKDPADKAQSAEVLKFFDWAFKNGKQLALDLDYVPLPDSLTNEIRSKVWSQIKR
jgi:phosphate transport system substrate-binding protein